MPTLACYDVLQSFQEIHRVIMNLAGELNDEQLRWKPKGYPTSIGFHLWHLARESDHLKAELLSHFPQIGPEFGSAIEIWQREALAQRWNFPRGLQETLGSGLSDEAAAALPIPDKEELLGYLHASYKAVEAYIELLDTKYSNFENMDEELRKAVELIRQNLLESLAHDCRHLGMMECLKGLQTPHAPTSPLEKRAGQTGFGSAMEKRK